MVDAFPSIKDAQSAIETWDRNMDRNMDTIMEISVAHDQPTLLLESQQQHFCCPLRWLALPRIANPHQPVASKLSYKHDIL